MNVAKRLSELPPALRESIYGLGIDIVSVTRIGTAIERCGEAFVERVYTAEEAIHCRQAEYANERFAACWAVKEAAVKALGTGFTRGIAYRDIELVSRAGEPPQLRFSGRFGELRRETGIDASWVSLSHERNCAAAVVLLGRATTQAKPK